MASYSSLNSSGMALEQSSQSINSSGLSLNSAASTIYSPNNTGSPRVGTMVPNRIFVGGIQAGTVEHELRSFFEVYGTVKDVKIIKDPNGTSKGFGFVTYENEEDAKRVQETAASTSDSGLEFKGRRLNVGPAIKKQNPYPPKAFDIFGSGLAPGAVFYTANGIPYTYHNGIALIPTADGGYAAVAQPTPQYAVIPQTIYVPAGNTQQSAYGQTAIMSAAQNQVQTISTAANTANNCTTAANNNGGGFTITQSAPNQYSVTAAQNGLRYATQMTSAYGPYVYQTSPTYGGGEIMTYAQLAASQGLSNQPEMQEYLAYDMENRRWANSSNNTSAVLSILNQKSPRKSQQLAYTSTSMAPRYSSTPHRGHMKSANGEMVNEGLMGEVVVTPPPTPITHDYQQH